MKMIGRRLCAWVGKSAIPARRRCLSVKRIRKMDMAEARTEPLAQRADKALIPQTVWLMAITVGVIVANIYYIQPLLAEIANTFGLSVTRAGIIAMLSQAGTALGMFLFVPLGDKY